MAPSNDYLLDEQVQQQLAAHNNKLIKGSTVWFPGEDPEVHWDFNRAKEYELLGAYLNGFTDLDYRDGNVTVEGATLATYGTADEYLMGRIATTHLNPASGFNKGLLNGEVVMVGADGATIIRDNRVNVAMGRLQVVADKIEHRWDKAITAGRKSLEFQKRRALKIAPTAVAELDAIVTDVQDHTKRRVDGE